MRDHKSLLAWQEANVVVKAVMLATRGRRHPCNHLDIAYASAVETAELLELTSETQVPA